MESQRRGHATRRSESIDLEEPLAGEHDVDVVVERPRAVLPPKPEVDQRQRVEAHHIARHAGPPGQRDEEHQPEQDLSEETASDHRRGDGSALLAARFGGRLAGCPVEHEPLG